jgi:TolB-like protein
MAASGFHLNTRVALRGGGCLLARLLFVLLVSASASVARADETTLAILPLTKASGSESWDGLGTALAGMLTSDLSQVGAIQLVERDRLDAVLAEIALSETAFVDPKTAQKLGKGVGAEAVLTGSFSVVGDTFLLDARIVETRTAKVLKAADAQGTSAEFVAVEKELVEELLEGLDVELDSASRRRLLMEAPTEAWGAFTEYGKGLDAQKDGRLDDAARSFEAALRADPKFELARAALSDLRALLEAEKAASRQRRDTAHAQAEAAVLAAWPGKVGRTTPNGDPVANMDTMIGLALRLDVLEDQERWCERAKEMQDHLAHTGWKVEEPARTSEGAFSYLLQKKAESLGYGPMPREVPAPRASYESVSERARILRGTWGFVLGGSGNLQRGDIGLIGAIRACYPIAERPGALAPLLEQARKAGAGGIPEDASRKTGMTIEEGLSIAWMAAVAAAEGATPDLEARSKALLANRTDDDPVRSTLIRELDDIAKTAEEWQTSRWRRWGQSDEVLLAAMRGLATADPAVVRTSGGFACARILEQEKNRGRDWLDELDRITRENIPTRPTHFDQAGIKWGILRDAGCLVSTPSRFRDQDELFAFLASAVDRAAAGADERSTCRMAFQSLSTMTAPAAMASSRSTPELTEWAVYSQLLTYHHQMVWDRCVEVP